MGIPALEDGLFENLLIFIFCFWSFLVFESRKGRKGQQGRKGLQALEVSHLCSREISRRMPSESCLGNPLGPELSAYL